MSDLGMFGRMKVTVVRSWVTAPGWEYLGRPWPVPTKREGRRGTRRAWKRQHPHGWRWGVVFVEPDHVLTTANGIYCTAAQYAAMQRRAA
jgi:hypothetical protein